MTDPLHWLVLAAGVALSGCASSRAIRSLATSPFQPSNVYRYEAHLPASVRRVAVLPVTGTPGDSVQEAGVQMLGPMLGHELSKAKTFELVFVGAEQLKSWTRQTTWDFEESLPPDFFQTLRRRLACDAVLFVRLTVYRPYPPLAVGWNMKLVECTLPRIWWAADEVFDAGSLPVVVAAEAYGRSELNLPEPMLDGSAMLQSPLRFGQYTVHALVQTLPPR